MSTKPQLNKRLYSGFNKTNATNKPSLVASYLKICSTNHPREQPLIFKNFRFYSVKFYFLPWQSQPGLQTAYLQV